VGGGKLPANTKRETERCKKPDLQPRESNEDGETMGGFERTKPVAGAGLHIFQNETRGGVILPYPGGRAKRGGGWREKTSNRKGRGKEHVGQKIIQPRFRISPGGHEGPKQGGERPQEKLENTWKFFFLHLKHWKETKKKRVGIEKKRWHEKEGKLEAILDVQGNIAFCPRKFRIGWERRTNKFHKTESGTESTLSPGSIGDPQNHKGMGRIKKKKGNS